MSNVKLNVSKINLNYFVGLDLSLTGTGLTVLEYEAKESIYGSKHEPILKLYKSKLVETKPTTLMEQRYLIIWNEISFIEKIRYCGGIYIEGLSYASTGSKFAELAGLHYFIRTKLIESNQNFDIIPPTTLKKYVTGKGNSNKNIMIKEIYKKWNVDFNDDNLADSYALARMSFEKWGKDNDRKSIDEGVDLQSQ